MKKILFSKNERGFTLIELLVVIAIIAVLASLSFVGLQNARRRGNDVAALGQMNAILAQAQICADTIDNTTKLPEVINSPATPGTTEICDLSSGTDAVWPILPTSWSYGATGLTFDGDTSNGDYKYYANSDIPTTDAKVISCNEGGCSKTGF